MQVGIHIGRAPGLAVKGLIDHMFSVVDRAEQLGFHSLWIGDHLIFPEVVSAAYPGTPSGRLTLVDTRDNMLETLTMVTAFAARTSTIKLGTNVLVLPYRHPLLTAKVLATIDAISGGRFVLGVGVGWMKEEFDAFGAASFADRGALTDEYIRILREVWSSPSPEFSGRWYRFGGFGFEPRPAAIPIWVGGASTPAVERVVRLGDGWQPSHIPPDRYAHLLELMQRRCGEVDRDPAEITLSLSIKVTLTDSAAGEELRFVVSEDRPGRFEGGAEQLLRTLERYQALGLHHVVLELHDAAREDRTQSALAALETVAGWVLPRVTD